MDIREINYEINEKEQTIECYLIVAINNFSIKHFHAKTTCLPEDEWNEETGKKISLLKAKRKVMDYETKRLKKALKKRWEIFDFINKDIKKLHHEWADAINFYNELDKEINHYL